MHIRIDDEVWVTLASLHQRNPHRADFSISEIVVQAESTDLTGRRTLRPSFETHVYSHCVANRPPSPSDCRMIFETGDGRRRLCRPSDHCHPERVRGKHLPKRHELHRSLRGLLHWYRYEFLKLHQEMENDPVLALRGLGKEIWSNESADEYVRRIRSDW